MPVTSVVVVWGVRRAVVVAVCVGAIEGAGRSWHAGAACILWGTVRRRSWWRRASGTSRINGRINRCRLRRSRSRARMRGRTRRMTSSCHASTTSYPSSTFSSIRSAGSPTLSCSLLPGQGTCDPRAHQRQAPPCIRHKILYGYDQCKAVGAGWRSCWAPQSALCDWG